MTFTRGIVLCFALLALAGCGRQGGAPHGKPEAGDVAVAKVGSDTIWASDVKREAQAQGLIGDGDPFPTGSDAFHRMLDQVVDQKLLAAEAIKRGYERDPTVRRRLEVAREKLLGDVLIENVVDKAVNDNAVRALYREQQKLAHQGEEIKAREIVSPTEEDADQIKKLLATGAAFDALAMQRSTDAATRFNGGDLGYFTLDAMPPAYGAALKTAKVGDTVGPFKTDAGFVIVRVEGRRPEQPISLEEARPQIVRFLTYDEIRSLLARLRENGKVKVLVSQPVAAPAGNAPTPAPGAKSGKS